MNKGSKYHYYHNYYLIGKLQVKVRVPQKQCEKVSGVGGGLQGYTLVGVAGGSASGHY